MALIEKRGAGQWRVRIRKSGYPDLSRTFDKKEKAERWAKKIETQMDDMEFVSRKEAERTSLKQLLERYRDEITVQKKGVDIETIKINSMILRPICKRKLSTLAPCDFAAYRDQRLKEVTAGTVNRELNIFSHAFNVAIKEWGIHLPNNPIQLISRPKNPRARDRRFRSGEEQRLFDAMDETRNPWIRPLIQLAIETAMRQGELLKLEWQYVDLKTRVAHLPNTKNGDPRDIPLTSEAIIVLRSLPRNISGRVFPITKESVKKAFTRLTDRAKLIDFHFHDLRHEATSRFFEKGLNIMEVSTITGHKDLQMLKRYTHLKAADLAKKIG